MMVDRIFVGTGFFIEPESGFIIELAEEGPHESIIEKSECRWWDNIIVIPPIDHKDFEAVFRHEKRHAKDYNFLMKFRFPMNLLSSSASPFKGLYELFTNLRTRSMILAYRNFRNVRSLLRSITFTCIIIGFLYLCCMYSLAEVQRSS